MKFPECMLTVESMCPYMYVILGLNYVQLLNGTKKSGIMGFCDPCPGEPKALRVEYTYRGDRFKVGGLFLVMFIYKRLSY